jgi:hypothetical protein
MVPEKIPTAAVSINDRSGPHNQTPIAGMANFNTLATPGASILFVAGSPTTFEAGTISGNGRGRAADVVSPILEIDDVDVIIVVPLFATISNCFANSGDILASAAATASSDATKIALTSSFIILPPVVVVVALEIPNEDKNFVVVVVAEESSFLLPPNDDDDDDGPVVVPVVVTVVELRISSLLSFTDINTTSSSTSWGLVREIDSNNSSFAMSLLLLLVVGMNNSVDSNRASFLFLIGSNETIIFRSSLSSFL